MIVGNAGILVSRVIYMKDGGVRMLFGGDVSLGRRFLDPTDQTPRDRVPQDHPDALIRVSDPLPGTKAVLRSIARQ